jgi:hypothetical protein
MFPRETVFSRFLKHLGRKPTEYGNIQQAFYAKPAPHPKPRLSIWSDRKTKIEMRKRKKLKLLGLKTTRIS